MNLEDSYHPSKWEMEVPYNGKVGTPELTSFCGHTKTTTTYKDNGKRQNKDSNKLINQVGSEFEWSPEGIVIYSGSLHPSTMQRKHQTKKTS